MRPLGSFLLKIWEARAAAVLVLVRSRPLGWVFLHGGLRFLGRSGAALVARAGFNPLYSNRPSLSRRDELLAHKP